MAANSQFSMAVHVLSVIAAAEEKNVKSEKLAASVNTNPVVIRRLLSQLNSAGLVSSQTGAFGGTRLTRPPHEITLGEIYGALDCGGVFALHAREPDPACPVGRTIELVLCGIQAEIDESVVRTLDQTTLADVLGRIRDQK